MKIKVLPAALLDLEQIEIYLTDEFGASAASATQAKLLDAFRLLANFPALGRARPDVTAKPVRFFLQRPYWIVYEPGAQLMIHRVYHAARDLTRIDEPERARD